MTPAVLGLVAAATGAGVMILEVMGVRVMAPWFGQSQLVWTHVIGVVLAALALGQWLGGRWADAGRGPGPATLLLAAGALGLALPELVALLGGAILPEDLGLLEAHPFVNLGSLLVALVALGLPMLALGAVTPWLVRLSRGAGAHPGRVVGRLLGAGTAGSLAGTFGATHLLLPWLGSSGAVRVAGGLLLLAAVPLWRGAGRPGVGALGLLVGPLAWVLLPEGPAALPGQLAQVETSYQLARVVEHEDGTRALLLNEGLDSFHSLWTADGGLTGMYYDAFLGPALAAPRDEEGRGRVLVVGLAAGTMARQLLTLDPRLDLRGVELDEELVALGRRWFELPEAVEVDAGLDARVVVRRDPRRYGAILIDAYSQQIYLPPHLTTVEFFRRVAERLEPGGVAALNVGGLSLDDPVVAAVCATFCQAFPEAEVARVPGTRNLLVMGWSGDRRPDLARALERHGLLPALAWMTEARRYARAASVRGRVLRDGDAPVEDLAHQAWTGEWVAPEPAPDESLDGAGTEDARLARCRDWVIQGHWARAERGLAPLAGSQQAGLAAEAELLLGNLDFERRQVEASRAHYRRALDRVSPDSVVAAAARGNLEALQALGTRASELEQRADSLGLWLAGALGLMGVGLLSLLRTPPSRSDG